MSTRRIDADLLGRFLTNEERNDPIVRSYIEDKVSYFSSRFFYDKILDTTLLHEASHAIYAESFGCVDIVLNLPYVEFYKAGELQAVAAFVSYRRRERLTPEQYLTMVLAGPIAETVLCPNTHTDSKKELEAGKEGYLERGGLESDFNDDVGRIALEIIEELNKRRLRDEIYQTAENFRRLFPPSISVR